MYSLRESNLIKNKINNFLKSTGLVYYDEKYIRSVNEKLTEIDFILNMNDCNVCISSKFINPAPSSSTITKFILNLNLIKELTNRETYGILLLKSEISYDSEVQLKNCPNEIMYLINNDKENLYKMFIQYMYSNNIFSHDSEGDTIMLEY
jgi:hypothetical protein